MKGATVMVEPRHRYSTVSILLHWTIAVLLLVQILLVGDAMTEGDDARYWVGLHKALGLSILALTVFRLGWRIVNPAMPLPAGTPRWHRLVARLTHGLFYAVLILLPLTGWLASSAVGRDIDWFGLFNWPLIPIGGGRETAGTLMSVHVSLPKLFYGLVGLHVLAALKHHFINRDNVLRRMLPFIPRRP